MRRNSASEAGRQSDCENVKRSSADSQGRSPGSGSSTTRVRSENCQSLSVPPKPRRHSTSDVTKKVSHLKFINAYLIALLYIFNNSQAKVLLNH